MLISKEYTLVIDTNSYAHKFYKELCAYCTGMIDETNEAKDYSDMFFEDFDLDDDNNHVAEEKSIFYDLISSKIDDVGIYSPCCVWLNKRYGINPEGEYTLLSSDNYEEYNFPAPLSVGIFFDVEPTEQSVLIIKQRAEKFFKEIWSNKFPGNKPVSIEGYRLITHTKHGEETEL